MLIELAEVVVLIAMLPVLLVLCLVLRVWLLRRCGTLVTVSLRPLGSGRWGLGLARYGLDRLCWYRSVGLSMRPVWVLSRGDLDVWERRDPTAAEFKALPADVTVLSCRTGGSELELAMARSTLTGFLSWLESSAPGATAVNRLGNAEDGTRSDGRRH